MDYKAWIIEYNLLIRNNSWIKQKLENYTSNSYNTVVSSENHENKERMYTYFYGLLPLYRPLSFQQQAIVEFLEFGWPFWQISLSEKTKLVQNKIRTVSYFDSGSSADQNVIWLLLMATVIHRQLIYCADTKAAPSTGRGKKSIFVYSKLLN